MVDIFAFDEDGIPRIIQLNSPVQPLFIGEDLKQEQEAFDSGK